MGGVLRVLVMGPGGKKGAFALESRGYVVIHVPVLRIHELRCGAERVGSLLGGLEQGVLAFTSSIGVDMVCRRLAERLRRLQDSGRLVIACIGPATARAVERCGLRADIVPREYRGRGLAEALCELGRSPVILARSARGLREVLEIAEECGLECVDVPVYGVEVDSEAARRAARLWLSGEVDVVAASSPSIARAFSEAVRSLDQSATSCRGIVAIGPSTAAEIKRMLGCIVPYPSRYSFRGIIELLESITPTMDERHV